MSVLGYSYILYILLTNVTSKYDFNLILNIRR